MRAVGSPLDIARWTFRLFAAAAGPLWAATASVAGLRGLEWLRTACLQIGDLKNIPPATMDDYLFLIAPWAVILTAQLGTLHRRSRIMIVMDVLRLLVLAAAFLSAETGWHYDFTPQPIAHVSCDWELWRDFGESSYIWQLFVVWPLAVLTLLTALAEYLSGWTRSAPNRP